MEFDSEPGKTRPDGGFLKRGSRNHSLSWFQANFSINRMHMGFSNRALYLLPQFFENKPLHRLIRPGIRPSFINDDAMGKCLDRIAKKDPTYFFADLAFPIANQRRYRKRFGRLDTTTLSFEGAYTNGGESPQEAPELVKVTYGHSKKQRPDLKQIVLSMVNSGDAGFPLWAEPLDGNASDKVSFHQTIARVREFQKMMGDHQEFHWVADSALYSKDHLLKESHGFKWVTRVPETSKEARELIERPSESISWIDVDGRYKIYPTESTYGGIKQRWLLVFSREAFERENATFEKLLQKEREAMRKALWHLSNQDFACEADARKRFDEVVKEFRFHETSFACIAIPKYGKRGRPNAEARPLGMVVRVVESPIVEKADVVASVRNTKGRFILATNDLDPESLPPEAILSEYKDLQKVERGFRFLKDPWFLLDKVFLKTPHRIAALTAVMALCLMVYNIGEFELRKQLAEGNTTLPNQLNKEIKNPTLRWIFQLLDGITLVIMTKGGEEVTMVANLTPLREKIIRLFGSHAMAIYGLEANAPT
jgi:transposase